MSTFEHIHCLITNNTVNFLKDNSLSNLQTDSCIIEIIPSSDGFNINQIKCIYVFGDPSVLSQQVEYTFNTIDLSHHIIAVIQGTDSVYKDTDPLRVGTLLSKVLTYISGLTSIQKSILTNIAGDTEEQKMVNMFSLGVGLSLLVLKLITLEQTSIGLPFFPIDVKLPITHVDTQTLTRNVYECLAYICRMLINIDNSRIGKTWSSILLKFWNVWSGIFPEGQKLDSSDIIHRSIYGWALHFNSQINHHPVMGDSSSQIITKYNEALETLEQAKRTAENSISQIIYNELQKFQGKVDPIFNDIQTAKSIAIQDLKSTGINVANQIETTIKQSVNSLPLDQLDSAKHDAVETLKSVGCKITTELESAVLNSVNGIHQIKYDIVEELESTISNIHSIKQNVTDEIESTKSVVIDNIQHLKYDATNEIESTKHVAINNIHSIKQDATNEIETTRSVVIEDLQSIKQDVANEIETTTRAAISNIQNIKHDIAHEIELSVHQSIDVIKNEHQLDMEHTKQDIIDNVKRIGLGVADELENVISLSIEGINQTKNDITDEIENLKNEIINRVEAVKNETLGEIEESKVNIHDSIVQYKQKMLEETHLELVEDLKSQLSTFAKNIISQEVETALQYASDTHIKSINKRLLDIESEIGSFKSSSQTNIDTRFEDLERHLSSVTDLLHKIASYLSGKHINVLSQSK